MRLLPVAVWVYSTRHLRVHGPLGVLISVERAITELVYRSLAAPLVVCYACAGGGKVAQSRDRLPPMKGWVDRTPMPLVRLIGALELAGAAGLILPLLTRIVPVPAVAAAIGLTLIQVGGIVVRLSRDEARPIGLTPDYWYRAR
jgi:hypothetical protein